MATKRGLSVSSIIQSEIKGFKLKIINALVIVTMICSSATLPAKATTPAKATGELNGTQRIEQTENTPVPGFSSTASDEPRIPQRPKVEQPKPLIGIRPESASPVQPNLRVSTSRAGEMGMDRTNINKNINPPLMFIENLGQFKPEIRFTVGDGNSRFVILSDGIEIYVADPTSFPAPATDGQNPSQPTNTSSAVQGAGPIPDLNAVKWLKLSLSFTGANPNPKIEGFDRLKTKISYPDLSDSKKRIENIPAWAGIRFIDLYPGVDLEISGAGSQWSWTLVDKSDSFGKNSPDIRLKIQGADTLASQETGLEVNLGSQTILLPHFQYKTPSGNFSPKWNGGNDLDGNEWIVLPNGGETSNSSSSENYSLTAEEPVNKSTSSGTQQISYTNKNLTAELAKGNFEVQSSSTQTLSLEQMASEDYSTVLTGLVIIDMDVDSTGSVVFAGLLIESPDMGGTEYSALAKLDPEGTQLEFINFYDGYDIPYMGQVVVDANDNIFILDLYGYSLLKFGPDGSLIYTKEISAREIAVNSSDAIYFISDGGSIGRLNADDSVDFSPKLTEDLMPYHDSYLSISPPPEDNSLSDVDQRIAIDSDGSVYITGFTCSVANFLVSEGAYQLPENVECGSFLAKLAPDMSHWVFSTFIKNVWSENNILFVSSLDIDSGGSVYLAGTALVDFGQSTNKQGFVYKYIPPLSTPVFTKRIGSDAEDYWARDVSIRQDGTLWVIGTTESDNFEVTSDAYQSTRAGETDSIIVGLDIFGQVIYATYFGDTGYDHGYYTKVDHNGNLYVCGEPGFPSWVVTFPYTALIDTLAGQELGSSPWNKIYFTKFDLGDLTKIREDTVLSIGRPKTNCNNCQEQKQTTGIASTQGQEGDPINTRTGAFDYATGDLKIQTSAGELTFLRTYSSVSTQSNSTLMGYGWTHNQDTRLIFPSDPGGESGFVLFKAHSVNIYRFIDNGDGTYTPETGLLSKLTSNAGTPVTYTIVDVSNSSYTFDEGGKITEWKDAQGHTLEYTYDSSSRLAQVSDNASQRFIALSYDSQGRISSVADHTGRTVTYSYDSAGDLTTMVDPSEQSWTYEYDDAHHLKRVEDPNGKTVVHTEYDAQGRAYQQFSGETKILEVTYNVNGTATITDSHGNQETHIYDSRNLLTDQILAEGGSDGKAYTSNFRPSTTKDPNGSPTSFEWSTDGANLTKVTDAYGGRTDLTYNSLSSLTQMIDPRGYQSTFTYEETNPDPEKRTLLVSTTDPLSNVTSYTYTTEADAPQPMGLVKTITDPLNRVIQFTYDANGQRIAMVDPANRTTSYAYDDLGRLIKVTDPSGKFNWTCYNASDQVVRTVINASGDGSTPQTDPCDASNYEPSTNPVNDRITSMVYDVSGNNIAVIDSNGIITRTYFDDYNRPVAEVLNLVGQDIDSSTPPTYDSAHPTQNIVTSTVYAADGNVIATIDARGIKTRTYYDANNRPTLVVQNWAGDDIFSTNPPDYNPSYPDRNVRTETRYDLAGNPIATISPSGRITRTYYDALSRPVIVTSNLRDPQNENATVDELVVLATPPAYDPAYPDRNVSQFTAYDAAGNVIKTTDALGNGQVSCYDADNRLIRTVRNPSGNSSSPQTTPCNIENYQPGQDPAFDQIIDYFYDEAGNQVASMDPAGMVTRTYFDALNRAVATTSNLKDPQNPDASLNQLVALDQPPAFDPDYPDQNLTSQTVYDSDNQIIAQIDPAGRITRTYYDEAHRPTIVVRNLTGQAVENNNPPMYDPDYPDQNVRAETVYDEKGNVIATIANDGIITRTYYDVLNHPTVVVNNLVGQLISEPTPPSFDPAHTDQNVRNEQVYGPDGSVERTIDPDGKITHTCLDGLNRLAKTVVNPSVADPCGDYSPASTSDADIISEPVFDLDGNQTLARDPNGKETSYQYDGQNRLVDEGDPLQNHIVYQYDADGNRVAVTNAKNVTTRFEYDASARLTAVIENDQSGVNADQETNVRTEYTYDIAGNLRTIKNALQNETNFTYDSVNRKTSETDALGHTTTWGYDASGNQTSLLDANGNTTYFEYDGLNRLILIDYPDPDPDVAFTYDAAGNRKTMSDGSGETNWDYDQLSRPTAITDSSNQVVGYQYSASGQRTTLTYPNTNMVTYAYDNAGRMQQVTSWDSLMTSYQYDKVGRLLSVELPNGVTSTYAYDDAGHVQAITHTNDLDTLSSFNYQNDDIGNRTTATETMITPDDHIFTDGFESGNLSAWSTAQIDGGHMSASSQAALIGSSGMLAEIVDNQPLYVEDQTPTIEPAYRARFYFDPNSIEMDEGDAFSLFTASDANSNEILRVTFQFSAQNYQVRFESKNDDGSWVDSDWETVTDEIHCFEVNWRSADIGMNNGIGELWVDGSQEIVQNGLDNDTLRIETTRLGAIEGVDDGTRGRLYFDGFEAHRYTAIGLDPDGPVLSPSDLIFRDGFESNNLTTWNGGNQTDSGDLSVTTQAALIGTLGLQAVVNDDHNLYVSDGRPNAERHYRARFYFDPNSITMAEGDSFVLFRGISSEGMTAFQIEVHYSDGLYQICPVAYDDTGNPNLLGQLKITDAPHALELEWFPAWSVDVHDGSLFFWVDDTGRGWVKDIDNDALNVDEVRLGIVSGIAEGTRGIVYVDGFQALRNNYIGLDPNGPILPIGNHIYSDGFENGNLAAWQGSNQTDGGDLSVATEAAMVGTTGLQAVINDDHNLYVSDIWPGSERHYISRFYFNPNSITMAEGDSFVIFRGLTQYDQSVVQVNLKYSNGEYQVCPAIFDDAGNPTTMGCYEIENRAHALELEWYAAWSPNDQDGRMFFWLDDKWQGNINGIDNDTLRVDMARLGVVSGPNDGTRGTVYYDGFVSQRDSYIGIDPDGPSLQADNHIFGDGFESEDLTAWNGPSSIDEGDLGATAEAAMIGSFGLLAAVNDDNTLYATDNRPINEQHYRARFYFDPNSIAMDEGDRLILFQGLKNDGSTAFQLEMGYENGYVVRPVIFNDEGDPATMNWLDITDSPHALELEWWAAWASDEHQGGMSFWLDNRLMGDLSNNDNDSMRVDAARLGVDPGSSEGIRGTLYFDGFESKHDGYLGLDPNGPELQSADAIFSNGFESGDLEAWKGATQSDNGDLSVTTQAAMIGNQGLQAVVNDNHSLYVADDKPVAEKSYQAQFYFDPNSITIGEEDTLVLFQGLNDTDGVVFQMELRFSDSDYQVRPVLFDDANNPIALNWVRIADRPQALRLAWWAASSPETNDGQITFWVDGNVVDYLLDADNDTQQVDAVSLGIITGAAESTTGTVYFDGFISQRSGSIELDPEGPALPPQGFIFGDGFESGDVSSWKGINQMDGGDLSVTGQAALSGSQGLQAVVNDGNSLFISDIRPFHEKGYFARFTFDPNSVELEPGDRLVLFQGVDINGNAVFQAELDHSWEGDYRVLLRGFDNNGNSTTTEWIIISDSPHTLQLGWGSAETEEDSFIDFKVDGQSSGFISGIDNDTLQLEEVRLGIVVVESENASGTIYFDEFESGRYDWSESNAFMDQNENVVADIGTKDSPKPVISDSIDKSVPAVPPGGRNFVMTAWQVPPAAPDVLDLTLGNRLEKIRKAAMASDRQVAYEYDPLGRLTAADYGNGIYFLYTYDAVGNRLTETTPVGTTTYTYDAANRLATVNGVAYTWDNNGNLLSDGASTYTYDYANRLKSITNGGTTYSYTYNGLGDRVSQTVGGVTTHYTLDLNAGLTQVLADGTYTYLYGNERIAQYGAEGPEYFLGDALGSMRQLVDGTGAVFLTKSYEPFGDVLSSQGTGTTAYGFDSEWVDPTGLTYLRARYYVSEQGRFITHDMWEGNFKQPISFNAWLYGYDNPILYIDPTGKISCKNSNDPECISSAIKLQDKAIEIKLAVQSGSLLPVEGFARLIENAQNLFGSNYRGMMWGLTKVIDGFEPNRGKVWYQGNNHQTDDKYFIGQNWLPYKNNSNYNVNHWGGTNDSWIHSLRGDWKNLYWDKTANQAYHFWFFAAVTFFDGSIFAEAGNIWHDPFLHWQNYDFANSPENEPPDVQGISKADYDLGEKGIEFGNAMLWNYYLADPDSCDDDKKLPLPNPNFNAAAWVRSNLKE